MEAGGAAAEKKVMTLGAAATAFTFSLGFGTLDVVTEAISKQVAECVPHLVRILKTRFS